MFSDFVQGGCKEVREHRRNKAMMGSYVPGAATSAHLGTTRRGNTLTANDRAAPRLGSYATAQRLEVVLLPKQRQSRMDVNKIPSSPSEAGVP